ncbi:MAG: hypothetical protein WDM85_13460 [Caulobacteraceae bacterium]
MLQLMPLARPAFQRPMLDLALAMNEERDGRLAQVFAADSPVRDPQVREILLRHDAGPALLVQQAKTTSAPDRERRTGEIRAALQGHHARPIRRVRVGRGAGGPGRAPASRPK